MRILKCKAHHYYDADKYAVCPHCGKEVVEETLPIGKMPLAKDTTFLDDDVTVSLNQIDFDMEVKPTVGWLVCIQGTVLGESFSLREGKNYIGRGESSDVLLRGDNSVSRDKHAIIIYDDMSRKFIAQPGGSKELYYLNGSVVLESIELKKKDILTIGKTKLLFIPLCGDEFDWKSLQVD